MPGNPRIRRFPDAAVVGRDLRAALLAVWCRTGRTARWVSKNNPSQPIVALCADVAICRRMALVRGVEPILAVAEKDEMVTGKPVEQLLRLLHLVRG